MQPDHDPTGSTPVEPAYSDPRLSAAREWQSAARRRTVGTIAGVALASAALTAGAIAALGGGEQTAAAPVTATVTQTAATSAPPAAPTSAAPASRSAASRTPAAKTTTPSPRATALPGSAKRCSATVGTAGRTSCSFAGRVGAAAAAKRFGAGADRFSVRAASPVTHKTYTMSCTNGAVTVCKGGNAAVVYLVRPA
ncbi:MAG: hypothetical protein LWW86_04200 [Micrococcales bacterium]|nr:hypothetical protein [Micrococcales bacterium]